MVYQPLDILPSTDELPCSDETPVDNEEQNLLPNLLLLALAQLWSERMDWYFGVDMAVYHRTGPDVKIPVVPDAFLSIGVERRKNGKYRRSYATWEEDNIVPIFVLEMVSHKYNDEYEDKMTLYARLGVLYYLVYNPEQWGRRGLLHEAFEIYRLEQGQYQLQTGEPFWMPEVGIGIG
ncbi:MAG: Uma2 family endonuclease [Cyanobacteria bacterium J06623_5]